MKRILLIDYACNTVDLARNLAKETDSIETIYVLSTMADPVTWGLPGIVYLPVSMQDKKQIIDFVLQNAIDLVVNFDIQLGAAGLLEALREHHIECIGSDKVFSDIELDKLGFKTWLKAHNFSTPDIFFQGSYENVLQKLPELRYPCVIKPDIQIGPQVQVCHNQKDIVDYFDRSIKRTPHAAYAINFLIEEYIPTQSVMGVLYYLFGGKAYLSDSVQFLFDEKSDANVDGGLYAINPHPDLENYREELQRLVNELLTIGDKLVGHVQCLIGKDKKLYVMENGSRPSTYSFMNRTEALTFLKAMATNDNDLIEKSFVNFWGKEQSAFALALLHDKDRIAVDIDSLSTIPESGYYPFSVLYENNVALSSHRKIPSIILFYGKTHEDALAHAQASLPQIYMCGDFRPMDFVAARSLLA